jgi:hypothetical protein
MGEQVEIGSVFKIASLPIVLVVFRIFEDDEGGHVHATDIKGDHYRRVQCRICNMIPVGKMTIEEMLVSPNPVLRELGLLGGAPLLLID